MWTYINMQGRKLENASIHLLFHYAVRRHISCAPQKVLVLGVYRYQNAPLLVRMAEEAARSQWEIRLWALDRQHPQLAAYSLGLGRGLKFSLLNKLIREKDFSDFDWIVVIDDDILLKHGSLAAFLALAQRAGMGIVQPAHALASFSNHPITVCDPLAIVRLTTFVEIGPVFAVNREWYDKVLPFPEDIGMGWGLDIAWSDLQAYGARLGIVDWVTLRHLHPTAKEYETAQEQKRLDESLHVRRFQSLADLQKTVAIWHVWQSSPPWPNRAAQ